MTTRLHPPHVDSDTIAAAAARFATHAEPDVAYAVVDSPVGALVAAATPRGLVRLAYEDFNGGLDTVLDSLANKLSPRILENPQRLDDVRRELDEYFDGRAHDLRPPDRLGALLRLRPPRAAGDRGNPLRPDRELRRRRAHRRQPQGITGGGRALGANAIPIIVPCHRVIGTSGKLTGYTGGMHRKEALLRLEGIASSEAGAASRQTRPAQRPASGSRRSRSGVTFGY